MDLAHARALIRWLDVARHLSDHTLRAYSSDLAALEQHVGPEAPVGRLSSETLFEFLEAERRSGLTPGTIRRPGGGLRGFCNWLANEGLLDHNPLDAIRLNLRRPRPLPRALPRHQLRGLIAHLSGRAERTAADATTLLSVA